MDLLSSLGVASAHPGGFNATKRLLDGSLGPGDLRILEVGCGTGKTSCYLAEKGYDVTALDRHPIMLEKAKQRSAKQGIANIKWVEGNVEDLPFEDESFDVVYAESVTIFTDVPKTLKEYYRVLKPNGRLMDREMVLYEEIPAPVYKEINEFFKFDRILTLDEWMEHFRQTGFRCDRPAQDLFRSHEDSTDPNEIMELDLSMLFDPEVGQSILKYADLMLAQEPYFRVCNFLANKTG